MPRLEKEINFSPREVGYSRLGFFSTFIKSQGLIYEDVARILGMSRVAVSHWFIADDVNLAIMKKVINSLEYDIEFTLHKENDEGAPLKIDATKLYLQKESGVELSNLSFLTLALMRYGITKEQMAKSIGLGYTAVRFWFQKDDISMSRLFQVCEGLGFSMSVKIFPFEKPVQNGGRHLRTEIVLRDDVIMKDIL